MIYLFLQIEERIIVVRWLVVSTDLANIVLLFELSTFLFPVLRVDLAGFIFKSGSDSTGIGIGVGASGF